MIHGNYPPVCCNMKLKTKRRLTQVSTGIFFLIGSVEYAVILPTIYAYLSKTYDAEPYFLGLCLSAFSLTGLLTAPLFGRWYDKTHKTKLIILFCNFWEIAGNFMYFMGISKYFILLSRLVAGVGMGCSSAIFAHISQTTTESERTAAITVAMAAREVGLLLGPGLNIFLGSLDFYIGPWHVNEYTSPGIFMCVLWIIMDIIIIFMYFDLPTLEEQEKMLIAERQIQDGGGTLEGSEEEDFVGDLHHGGTDKAMRRPPYLVSIESTAPHLPTYMSSSFEEPGVLCKSLMARRRDRRLFSALSDEDELGKENNSYDSISVHSCPGDYITDEDQHTTSHRTAVQANGTLNDTWSDLPLEENPEYEKSKAFSEQYGSDIYPGKWSFCKEYIRDQVIVLLTAQFFLSFNQTCLETILTPMTNTLLNFGVFQNSLVFCGAGVEILVVYAFVHFLSSRVEDRKLLVVGVLLTIVSMTWLLYFVPTATPDEPGILPIFLIAIFFDVAGLPFFAAVVVSLYSKITSDRTQGISQGIRRTVDGIGTILGPLWGSGALHILYINFGVMEGLLVMLLVMIVFSWKRLVSAEKYWWLKTEKEDDVEKEDIDSASNDSTMAETKQLLSSDAQVVS